MKEKIKPRLEDLIEEFWKETWNIIRVSDAYKQELPLRDCKPMLSVLFESAMYRLAKELDERIILLKRFSAANDAYQAKQVLSRILEGTEWNVETFTHEKGTDLVIWRERVD